MNVLVACEESQRVCIEFRNLGHRAFSADVQECSGGHPEWHILGDVLPILDGNCTFVTQDGVEHEISGEWDLIIAHPPCTYLTITGNRWFDVDVYGDEAIERAKKRDEAEVFFMKFVNAKCKRIAIENPIGFMSTRYRMPDQIIQPYEFGDPVLKKTCLWLKNLPNLKPTDNLHLKYDGDFSKNHGDLYYAKDENGKILAWNDPMTAKLRSKTFVGIAKAMADQWGSNLPPIIDSSIVNDNHMNVLVACEESQAVCVAFRRKGHRAFSCDMQPCSGSYPEWHIQGDVLKYINGNCAFKTADGIVHHQVGKWDLIIAHPPCTYLTRAGAVRVFRKEFKEYPSYGTFQMVNVDRISKGIEARDFFMRILNADCDKIAIENPVPLSVFMIPAPTQTVEPYQFGDPYTKKTCLWLKGLPKLVPSNIVEPMMYWVSGGVTNDRGKPRKLKALTSRVAKVKAQTFVGMANAMADQWG